MGSVHYSSPEQVRGGYSDYKSDIYSLGITMYEMVTGRVPFDGDTTVAIAIKHLQEEIESPSKYTPNLPFALEQIILKCTQKSPDRRYNNMAELIDDLKHSLMEPQGNFVKVTPLSSHAETVMVSAEELSQIRSGAAAKANAQTAEEPARKRYSKIEDEEEDEDYSYEDEEDEDEDEEEDDRDSYDEDDDDSYYDDEDDDDKAGNKLEKIITIGGFCDCSHHHLHADLLYRAGSRHCRRKRTDRSFFRFRIIIEQHGSCFFQQQRRGKSNRSGSDQQNRGRCRRSGKQPEPWCSQRRNRGIGCH